MDIKKEDLKKAKEEYVESKELVLMSYPPECIDNVKEDMKIAFVAGAKWMAGQGVTKECPIGMATEEIFCNITEKTLDELGICPGDKVIVQIRKAN